MPSTGHRRAAATTPCNRSRSRQREGRPSMPSDLQRLELALENAASALAAVVGLENDDRFPCTVDATRVPALSMILAREAAQVCNLALELCGRSLLEPGLVDEFLDRLLG